ncbi:MAG TPA: aminopeptidase N [Halothiobacillaceae bacterium]|nr:aminopeptidase N [Halothiobacillaceae bacterium]
MSPKTAEKTPSIVRLSDYRPPDFLIKTVELTFDLAAHDTEVEARMSVVRNGQHNRPLVLDGDRSMVRLTHLEIDGQALCEDHYQLDQHHLIIQQCPDEFNLTVRNRVDPAANTALDGLYQSSGNFCTQCEPQGFRRITYFLDRPDVLSVYTVNIIADGAHFPVLLSNGNPLGVETLEDGRLKARWHDPFPKPSYLFALVAGNLKAHRDRFVTESGRKVELAIYVEPHNIDRCAHAMASLKKSMRWDETAYGREYDLDVFNIVAVDDFNMGAMENKGLNIFNSKFILARAETATDSDFEGIESVVAHEYFHNWSGNRVTCRDWFQLSLKEGFTVFRDQCFSADMHSAGVQRIKDVSLLRQIQFAEDAGPQAHPVQPKQYQQINNFYTATVYNKGAEVVRMWRNLLGADRFREATDRYFARFDGQAVRIEDFIAVMDEQADFDTSQFRRWYDRAGTPIVTARSQFIEGQYTLELSQTIPEAGGQTDQEPFLMPLRLALFDHHGKPLALNGPDGNGEKEITLIFNQTSRRIQFELDTEQPPVLSINRGFSAPVIIEHDYSDEALGLLARADNDPFNRFDAYQRLVIKTLRAWIDDACEHGALADVALPEGVSKAFGALLHESNEKNELDARFVAECMQLPSESYLAEQFQQNVPVEFIAQARTRLRELLADEWAQSLMLVYQNNEVAKGYRFEGEDIGKRALRLQTLTYLNALDHPAWRRLATEQYHHADNMTERFNALVALSVRDTQERETTMAEFAQTYQDDPLVMDKWFALSAQLVEPDQTDRLLKLEAHPLFSIKNPNRVRALVGSFARNNLRAFHAASGSGYKYVSDKVIELDAINPQIAARLATVFSRWQRFDGNRADHMRAHLERMIERDDCSSDLNEIARKALSG